MNLGSFILALVGPVLVRAIIALGFTAVTFTGITVLTDSLVEYAQSSWSAVPLTVIQLASLSGIPEFLGMIFGALVARVAISASVGASKYVLKTP